MVWTKKNETWERYCIATRFGSNKIACKAKTGHHIALLLQNVHYTLLRQPGEATFPTFWLRECPEVWRHLEGGVSTTEVLSDAQNCTPARSSDIVSIHSVSSGSDVLGRATPSVHSAASSHCSARTPTVYSFVGSGAPSIPSGVCQLPGQSARGVDGPSTSADALSVPFAPARCRSSKRPTFAPDPSPGQVPAVRGQRPASSASFVTPSVLSQDSRLIPMTPSAHSFVWPGNHEGVPRKRLRTKSICTEAFTSCTCQQSGAQNTHAATIAKDSQPHARETAVGSSADQSLYQEVEDNAQYRPDVAPYPRQHPVRKKKLKDSLKLPQGEQVWFCPKCHFEIRIEPGLKARQRLRAAKSNHTMNRHTQAERREITRLGNVTEIFEPSHDLPQHERAWTCHRCQKGLPSLPRAWSDASIRKHFEVAHPDETPTDVYRQKQREDPALRERMKKRGEWAGLVKQQRQQETLHTWGPDTGHDLSYLCFKDPPPEGFKRQQRSLMWLTCAHCRRIGSPNTFKTTSCEDAQRPIHFNSRNRLKTLAQVSQGNYDAIVTAFKLSADEAQENLGCRPSQTEVPGQDPNAGVRIGEAQNPGPRRRIQHQDTLKVWTFNCGGPKQAWALWNHMGNNTTPKVIFLQETSFKKHEWISFQKERLPCLFLRKP